MTLKAVTDKTEGINESITKKKKKGDGNYSDFKGAAHLGCLMPFGKLPNAVGIIEKFKA